MKLIEVEWLDAHVSTESTTIKRAMKIKPIRTFTAGYLIAENEHGLNMVTDKYPQSTKEGKVVNHIPWGMIVQWWEYE